MTTIVEVLRSVAPQASEGMKPGHNYVLIRCPFHGDGQERTPSCSVSLIKPVWFCHACSASGHLSQLLRRFGLSSSTTDLMIQKAGLHREALALQIQSTRESPNPYRGSYTLPEDVLDTYRMMPLFLAEAGFKKRVLRHFEVGYDAENLRATFPLRNYYGDLVGISGRSMANEEPRYKIYGDELRKRARREGWSIDPNYTVEAVKRAMLWHCHLVHPMLTVYDVPVIITEGFKACMWVYQAGYQCCVALIGNQLSDLQSSLLARMARQVILFLDNNEAGWDGTFYAASRLERRGLDPLIALYPDEREQPDSLDPDEIQHAIKHAQRFIEWRRQ